MPVAQIAGRLAVSLSIHPKAGQSLEVRIYDAFGNCLLDTNMKSDSIRLDQRRLEPGDYLICFQSPGPGVAGEGSKNAPNSRLLSELPERPLLDEILAQPDSEFGDVAIPRFAFSAQ